MFSQKETMYAPFRTGVCAAVSFFLLRKLEEWSFLSLLSSTSLITKISRGL